MCEERSIECCNNCSIHSITVRRSLYQQNRTKSISQASFWKGTGPDSRCVEMFCEFCAAARRPDVHRNQVLVILLNGSRVRSEHDDLLSNLRAAQLSASGGRCSYRAQRAEWSERWCGGSMVFMCRVVDKGRHLRWTKRHSALVVNWSPAARVWR